MKSDVLIRILWSLAFWAVHGVAGEMRLSVGYPRFDVPQGTTRRDGHGNACALTPEIVLPTYCRTSTLTPLLPGVVTSKVTQPLKSCPPGNAALPNPPNG